MNRLMPFFALLLTMFLPQTAIADNSPNQRACDAASSTNAYDSMVVYCRAEAQEDEQRALSETGEVRAADEVMAAICLSQTALAEYVLGNRDDALSDFKSANDLLRPHLDIADASERTIVTNMYDQNLTVINRIEGTQ